MPRIEIVEDTSEKVVFRALVYPFGSPERKDFSGEFFHAGTDFGDSLYDTKVQPGFYEHNINKSVNPHKPPEHHYFIGKSTYVKTDDAGVWADFEVERSNRYLPLLLLLHEQRRLGASGQAYVGTKRLDPKVPGKIDAWWGNERSLTPTPDNPDTILKDEEWEDQLKALTKSVSPELYDELYPAKADADIYVSLNASVKSDDVAGITDQISEILAEAPQGEEQNEPEDQAAVIAAAVATALAPVLEKIAGLEADLAKSKAAQAQSDQALKQTAEWAKTKFTEIKTLFAEVKTVGNLSSHERSLRGLPPIEKAFTPPTNPAPTQTVNVKKTTAFNENAPGA